MYIHIYLQTKMQFFHRYVFSCYGNYHKRGSHNEPYHTTIQNVRIPETQVELVVIPYECCSNRTMATIIKRI